MFKGIFYSYFKNYSSKFINKLVKIEASTTSSSFGKPIILLNPDVNGASFTDIWQSESIENSSITISLLKERLLISSYSLKTRTFWSKNTPYEWVLEGSNDLINWVMIHHKSRGNELIATNSAGNWNCPSSAPYRFFKFIQLGENYKNNEDQRYMLTLSKIEFFGMIYPNERVTCYQRKRNDIKYSILLLIAINQK